MPAAVPMPRCKLPTDPGRGAWLFGQPVISLSRSLKSTWKTFNEIPVCLAATAADPLKLMLLLKKKKKERKGKKGDHKRVNNTIRL